MYKYNTEKKGEEINLSFTFKMTITEPYEKALTIQTMNPLIKNVEYAVRGQLAIRAEELRQELAEGKEYPFDRIVNCNIGNPQQLNQQPITFFRQVKPHSGLYRLSNNQ